MKSKILQLAGIVSVYIMAAVFCRHPFALEPKTHQGDGRLALFNFHEDEYIEIVYRKGEDYLPAAMERISHAMRSHGDGKTHTIDTRLIELIDAIQDHFGAETVEVISGYRSPGYNSSLKLEGKDVAEESLHMRGMAADIHLDEVLEKDIFDYAAGLGLGGVGLYPRFAFVHVDVGRLRTWGEKEAGERALIGTENNPNPAWITVTDKNIYHQGDLLTLQVTNNSYGEAKLTKNLWYEKFGHGKWEGHEKIKKGGQSTLLKPSRGTKMYWKIPGNQSFGKYRLVVFTSRDFSIPPAYSNEFYIKKLRHL